MEEETKKREGRLMIEEDDSEEEEEERILVMETETKRGRLIEEEEDSEFFLLPEIKTEILSRLPGDSAIGCRLISKQWRSLVDHPSFLETHISTSSSSTSNSKKFGNYLIPNSSTSSSGLFLCAHQYNMKFRLRFVEYNDDDVDGQKLVSELKPSKSITRHPFPFYLDNNWGILLMSSCNGLVFMGSTIPNYIDDMFVCNPFTREYVNLRTKSNTNTNNTKEEEEEEEQQRRRKKKGRMAYGFGYLPSTNEYKIVSIYYPDYTKERKGKGKVSVYTLGRSGRGRWRNKGGEIPYGLYNAFHPGFFANGAIHWFDYADKKKIVTFDLADEEFRRVVPSPPVGPLANHVHTLGVLGGCLCVTRSDSRRCENPKHIWVLNLHTKKEGKHKFSWNKRFIIPWKGIASSEAEPCVILNSGKVLLLSHTGLISYDPKTGAFNEGGGSFVSWKPQLKVIPYTKSFVSLKALGEEDAKCFGKFVFHDIAQQQHWQQQQQQQG